MATIVTQAVPTAISATVARAEGANVHDVDTQPALTVQERIARISDDLWVPYPQGVDALKRMRRLMDAPSEVRPESLAIVGDPSYGKTHLLKTFYRRHQSVYRLEGDDGSLNLLHVEMPEKAEPAALLREMHRVLGVGYSMRDPLDELIWRIVVITDSMQIRLFLIDEVHNAFRGTLRQQQAFLNVLRGLTNRTKRPLVIAGTPAVKDFLRNDEQLQERFACIELPRWSDPGDAQRLMKGFEQELRLQKPSGLASEETTALIIRLTGGRMGNICRLLRWAAIEAIRSGTEHLDVARLKVLAKQLPGTATRPA